MTYRGQWKWRAVGGVGGGGGGGQGELLQLGLKSFLSIILENSKDQKQVAHTVNRSQIKHTKIHMKPYQSLKHVESVHIYSVVSDCVNSHMNVQHLKSLDFII